jgi:nucleotide-binding universal stress UspA family protein
MIDNFHRSEGKASLRGARAAFGAANVPLDHKILVGHPAEVIAAEAAEAAREHVDRIVMGCRAVVGMVVLMIGAFQLD